MKNLISALVTFAVLSSPSAAMSGNLTTKGASAQSSQDVAHSMQESGAIIPGSYIVVLKESKQDVLRRKAAGSVSARQISEIRSEVTKIAASVGVRAEQVYSSVYRGFSGRLTDEQARVLRNSPEVQFIEADRTVQIAAQTIPWGINRINSRVAHVRGLTGGKVKVGVIDTGIDYLHPELAGNYVGGIDLVNRDNDPMDDHGHGTHVAGTIAAADNAEGVVGVAPTIALYGIKVLPASGGGTFSDVIAGIDWATANRMAVVNMSLGSRFASGAMKLACDNAFASGVVICAAAGNESGGAVIFPAGFESCIAVSAIDEVDNLAVFSSKGPQVELTAPGENILSTAMGGGLRLGRGTSMACPHVAGVAALVWSTGMYGTAQEVRDQLTSTANDIGIPGRDINFGFGIVDADAATKGAGKPQPPIVLFSVSRRGGCNPLVVTFTDESIGSPTEWLWDFGDGTTSTTQNPLKIYRTDGLFPVTLTATNAAGRSELTKTDLIFVNHLMCLPPVAAFTATPTFTCADIPVSFADSSVGAVLWRWSFGDGTASDLQNPTHVYSAPGLYNVRLIIINFRGQRDSHTKVGYLDVRAPLSTFFNSSVQSGPAPLEASFSDNSTGGPEAWDWDFGDKKGSLEQNPTHIYSKPGTYTVKLTASNTRCGAAPPATRVGYIIVSDGDCTDLPVANFSGTPISGTPPLLVDFTDLSTGSPTSWRWSFGDDTKSESQNPTHLYTLPGRYDVTLLVTNQCGKSKTVKKKYVVVAGDDAGGLGVASLTPSEFELAPNYPNPFNPSTKISFSIPEATYVSLEVYNIAGQRVTSLVNSNMSAGVHTVEWDATMHASGMYFYKLSSNAGVLTRKMTLIK